MAEIRGFWGLYGGGEALPNSDAEEVWTGSSRGSPGMPASYIPAPDMVPKLVQGKGGGLISIAILGVDLGKNACGIFGADATARTILRRPMRRKTLIDDVARLSNVHLQVALPKRVISVSGLAWFLGNTPLVVNLDCLAFP